MLDSLWHAEVGLHEVIVGKLICFHVARWPQKALIGLGLQLVFHLKTASANAVQGWKEITSLLLQNSWKCVLFCFYNRKAKDNLGG